jgi:hypothetical protein
LFNAEDTEADEGVAALPGANAEVAVDRVERQPLKVESVLRAVKNFVQSSLIPEGISEVAVEVDGFCAKTAEERIETMARDLSIF